MKIGDIIWILYSDNCICCSEIKEIGHEDFGIPLNRFLSLKLNPIIGNCKIVWIGEDEDIDFKCSKYIPGVASFDIPYTHHLYTHIALDVNNLFDE